MKEGCNLLVCEATCTLFGCVIGAGILGIPFVASQSGLMTGMAIILFLGLVILLLNFFIGEVVLRTKGSHQLTGYAEKYLGKKGKFLMTLSMLIGIYGALTAYMIGEGQVLSALLPIKPLYSSLIFLFIAGIIVCLGLKTVQRSETLFGFFFLILITIIMFLSYKSFNIENVTPFSLNNIFLPYGVILFAFIGTVSVPEMRRILIDNKIQLKKCIILGSLIPIISYLLFTLIVVGVTGTKTSQIATVTLGNLIGPEMIFFGNLFAVFAMATSFLVLGLSLRDMFMFDYKINKLISAIITLGIPLIIFLLLNYLDMLSFISVIAITGIFAGGIDGILIVLMLVNAKRYGERKPEYSIGLYKAIGLLLITVFVYGMIDQLIKII